MIISFLAIHQDTRVTSYSIRNKYAPGGSEELDLQSPSTDSTLGTTLSQILSNTQTGGEVVTVAFKSLPVDTAQAYTPFGGEDTSAPPVNAKEAVERIVEMIAKSCSDFGAVDEGFVQEEDVVRYEPNGGFVD